MKVISKLLLIYFLYLLPLTMFFLAHEQLACYEPMHLNPIGDSVSLIESVNVGSYTLGNQSLRNTREPITPQTLYWLEEPANQRIKYGSHFFYDLNATAAAGIDSWWLNNTLDFTINQEGVIRNSSNLALGLYGLTVRVNDTLSNELSADFTVNVVNYGAWTVLAYIDGDNYLERYAFNNLNRMELVGSTEQVNLITFVDFKNGSYAPFSHAECYNITYDVSLDFIRSSILTTPLPREPNMGDWRTLRDFLFYGQTIAPADHYLLLIFNRGRGIYGCCFEESQNDVLYADELSLALINGLIEPLDVIFFDCGLMAQLEIVYEVCNFTDYIVVSEEPLSVTGLQYELVFQELRDSPQTTPLDLAKSIVHHYMAPFRPGGVNHNPSLWEMCFSVIDADRVKAVTVALDQFSQTLLSNATLESYYDTLCIIKAVTRHLDQIEFVDLDSLVDNILLYLSGSALISNATELYLRAKEAIVYSEASIINSTYSGLSLTFHPYEHLEMKLREDTKWGEFLEVFSSYGESPEASISWNGASSMFGFLEERQDTCFYRFTAPMSTVITVSMNGLWMSPDCNFDLYLLDTNLNVLAFDFLDLPIPTISLRLQGGHVYYILVKSRHGFGVYHLRVHLGGLITSTEAALILTALIISLLSIALYQRYRHQLGWFSSEARKQRALRKVWTFDSPIKSAYWKIYDSFQKASLIIDDDTGYKQFLQHLLDSVKPTKTLAKKLLQKYRNVFNRPAYKPEPPSKRELEDILRNTTFWQQIRTQRPRRASSPLDSFEISITESHFLIEILDQFLNKVRTSCRRIQELYEAGTRYPTTERYLKTAVTFSNHLKVTLEDYFTMIQS